MLSGKQLKTICEMMKTFEVSADSSMMGILHRGVKEFDGVCPTLAAELVALNRYLDADALEVDDDGKGDDGRDQVHNIGETIPPERLVESMSLVVLGEEEVEERNK